MTYINIDVNLIDYEDEISEHILDTWTLSDVLGLAEDMSSGFDSEEILDLMGRSAPKQDPTDVVREMMEGKTINEVARTLYDLSSENIGQLGALFGEILRIAERQAALRAVGASS